MSVNDGLHAKAADLPRPRLILSERRFSYCQAGEDDCDYAHCPRWRNGELISEEHCALDLIGRDEDDE